MHRTSKMPQSSPPRPRAQKKTAPSGTPASSKPSAKRGSKKVEAKATLGIEAQLWEAADLMRNNMDPAEYKHVVLGLLFLKYISDAFEERRDFLRAAVADKKSDYFVAEKGREAELEELLEDRDEYTAENIFWVPKDARWSVIQAQAKLPTIGKTVDDAMDHIEQANPTLKGALPKIYALPSLDKQRLGELIDLISGIGLGSKEHRDKDTLGRVYEYFLAKFASAEGKNGGQFYTPQSVVRVLVEIMEPYKGRVYDPCCGSGGMFVQSMRFIDAHNGRRDQVTIYGQESNYTTWRLARMNLAIRGIEANLGDKQADTFHEDLHPDLRADFVIANPHFNDSDWRGEKLREDVRWKYGVPPVGNANFAWVQHFVHHLSPGGTAGFVLANGSMSSMSSGEGEIRKKLVEGDLIDCMVALPGQLFYSTQIPVCLWFLTKNKKGNGHRNRQGETLFIDARKLGTLESRVLKVLTEKDVAKIADTYHAWRNKGGKYEDVPGFCASVKTEDIAKHDFVLTPGRYVGAEDVEEDAEGFGTKLARLHHTLRSQLGRAKALDAQILDALETLAR